MLVYFSLYANRGNFFHFKSGIGCTAEGSGYKRNPSLISTYAVCFNFRLSDTF